MFPFQKAIVIGCPGAGKSTFARKLRDATGLPLYYLDMLWHKAGRTNVTREEFDRALQNILAQDAWILDGNYQRTLQMRLEACEAVFLLDFPLGDCLAGASARIGRKREDLPWIETEFDPEFRQWILDFPQTKLPQIYALLAQYQGRRTIEIFKSRTEAAQYLETLSASSQA